MKHAQRRATESAIAAKPCPVIFANGIQPLPPCRIIAIYLPVPTLFVFNRFSFYRRGRGGGCPPRAQLGSPARGGAFCGRLFFFGCLATAMSAVGLTTTALCSE